MAAASHDEPRPAARAARIIQSPVGPLRLEASATGLTRLHFVDDPSPGTRDRDDGEVAAPEAEVILDVAVRELDAYFAGGTDGFDVPLDLRGTTFQRQVWDLLRAIPHGATASYGELARQLGSPGASRAVGLANNKNPVAIVVPCHRVVGADGSLTGYAGGLDRKRALLDLESGVSALL